VSRLYLAQAQERLGQPDVALRNYFVAMKTAQGTGQWLNAATTAPGLRSRVEHAVNFVNQGRRRLFDQVLVPIRSRYGAGELARVENCLRVIWASARRRTPILASGRRRCIFPICRRRRTSTGSCSLGRCVGGADGRDPRGTGAVLSEQRGREAVFHTEELARQNLRGGAAPPKWEGFYFYRHGERREDNCSRCPATDRALQMAPLMQVRDLGRK